MTMQNKHILFAVGGFVLAFIVMCIAMAFHYGGFGDRDDMYGRGHYMNNGSIKMDDEMGLMTSGLTGKTGDNFDKAFIKEMIAHHEGAVAMANMALVNGKHSEIKTLANAIIAAQTKEIGDMQAWYKNWYGEDISGSNPPNSAEGAPMGSIHNMPVPAAVSSARTALATRLNISESKILIMEAKETNWPDACLGLKEQGGVCAQVVTPGYNVLMQANGKEYRYRTNQTGSVVKAEK